MMKKLIVLLLIFIAMPVITVTNGPSAKHRVTYPPEVDGGWEYVKSRLFGESMDLYNKKINGPILIELQRATIQDSIIVNSIMEELKNLLPNKKIDYVYNYAKDYSKSVVYPTDINKKEHPLLKNIIKVSFKSGLVDLNQKEFKFLNQVKMNDSIHIEYLGSENLSNYPFGHVHFRFGLGVSLDDKSKYIRLGVFRELCKLSEINFSNFNILKERGYDNNLYTKVGYIDKYTKFTVLDKILLQKVYSDDFEAQFKDYLFNHYPWQYVVSFVNKNLVKFSTIIILFILGLLVFGLSLGFFYSKKFKYTCSSYIISFLISLYTIFNLGFLHRYIMDLEHIYSLETFIMVSASLILMALVFGLFLWTLERIIIKKRMGFGLQLILKMSLTLISILVPTVIFLTLDDSKNKLFFSWEFPPIILAIIFAIGRGVLIFIENFSDSLVKEKDVELSRLKEANAQSELKLLQSHINPHFLYNALNSIAGLAHSNPDKTEKMALSLSNLFRYSINKKGQKMSTVKEEVLMVENYLEIEKIRFGDRLKFTLDIDETLENEEIPMYILQPLVENAIKHGISEIRGEGLITLEIKKELDTLYINVRDNGPGFPSGLVSGHGIQTVYDLLRLSYGNKAFLKWENTPVKQISISITKG